MHPFTYYAPTEVVFGPGTEERPGHMSRNTAAAGCLWSTAGAAPAARPAGPGGGGPDRRQPGLDQLRGRQTQPHPGPRPGGVRAALDFGADFVLAVGAAAPSTPPRPSPTARPTRSGTSGDFWSRKATLERSTPVGVILTIPAA